MKDIKFLAGAMFFCAMSAGLLQAQATRTWVSGTGDDANPCSRTAPCHTFAGAISKTTAGGEIDALDPGAYGVLTITKAITLDGAGGQIAGVTASGVNGFTINAGANDVITIRNLSINGLGTGLNGIRFLAGKGLHVDHCRIQGFTGDGIQISASAGGFEGFIRDTISQDNGGNGLYAIGNGGDISISIDNTRFDNNLNGVFGASSTRFSIRNSGASNNSQAGFLAQANAGTTKMNLTSSTADSNLVGLQAGGGSTLSVIRAAGVSLFLNGTGWSTGSNGTLVSYENNANSGLGTPSVTQALQ